MKNLKVMFLSEVPLIKYGLKCGFDQLGHETQYLDNECSAIWLKPLDEHIRLILNRVKSFNPDLIISEGYTSLPINYLYPIFKKMGIQTHLWDIEADCTPQIGEYFINHCDYLWTTMEEKINDFKTRGYKTGVGLLQFGCNPLFHKPVSGENRFKHDISLVARNYSNRYKEAKWLLMSLLEKKYDIIVYGIWWNDYSRPINLKDYPNNYWNEEGYSDLPYEWLPIVINSSKCMLGMNVPVKSKSHCSMRPFETLSSSDTSLLLGHYQEAQYRIFGDYMYHAHNQYEAEKMVKEILSMTDEQRKEKADLARNYVYQHHNYTLRAKQVCEKYFELGGIQ